MVKNYKLVLIGVLVSCSLSNAIERPPITVVQAEIEIRNTETLKRQAEAKIVAEKRKMGARPTMSIVLAEIKRRDAEALIKGQRTNQQVMTELALVYWLLQEHPDLQRLLPAEHRTPFLSNMRQYHV